MMDLWFWLIYAAGISAVIVIAAIVGVRFKRTFVTVPALSEKKPKVSVIVPARNEERNITRCARGLTGQHYPKLELIFVDDDSQDATPQILAGFEKQDKRVQVMQTADKPLDWNGKQWACHTGARAAVGDWLCFMDADTYAEPDLIERALALAASEEIDMLTLQPWYEMQGLWERIVMPAALMPLLLVFPPGRVNDPQSDTVIANGQFILIRRAIYEKIDGHSGVRDRMMDDFSLAENVHKAGGRVYIADGADVIRVRMYRGLREIWSGALKASVQITGGWLKTSAALVANLLINVTPAILFVWALIADHTVATITMGGVLALQTLYAAAVRVVGFRTPPWTCFTHPLGSLIASLILLDGMLRVATGREIRWKDRAVIGAPALPTKPIGKITEMGLKRRKEG